MVPLKRRTETEDGEKETEKVSKRAKEEFIEHATEIKQGTSRSERRERLSVRNKTKRSVGEKKKSRESSQTSPLC